MVIERQQQVPRQPDKHKGPREIKGPGIIPFPPLSEPGLRPDEYPTPKEIEAANAGQLGNPLIDLIKRHPLATGVASAGTVALTGYAAVPGIHQEVDKTLAAVRNQIDSAVNFFKPQTFEQQYPIQLDPLNFQMSSPDSITNRSKALPITNLEKHKMNILFPFSASDISNAHIRYVGQFNAVLPPFIDAKQLQEEGIKNIIQLTGFPKGTVIYSPIEGSAVSIETSGVKKGEGPQAYTPAYTVIRITFTDKDGKEYAITISGLHAKPLADIPPYPTDHTPITGEGLRVKALQPLFQLESDAQTWDGQGTAGNAIGQVVIQGFYAQREPRAPIPMDIGFMQAENGLIMVPQIH